MSNDDQLQEPYVIAGNRRQLVLHLLYTAFSLPAHPIASRVRVVRIGTYAMT